MGALFRAWGLCVVVALFGVAVAWVSAEPLRAWPSAAGALVLLFFHAPRRGALERS